MRLLMLGAGRVGADFSGYFGGYFGGRLAAADADIAFLVRPARGAPRASKRTISSPHGDKTVAVADFTFDATMPQLRRQAAR